MSDLRDRIAAVLDSIPADLRPSTLVNLDRADAVIAALGLHRESPQLCDGGINNYRYVTDWENDE